MQPVKRTQAERREQTQRKLIDSAYQLFGERGYSKTSIEDIAADAGMTEGAVYHHYKTKKRLFAAVTAYLEDKLAEDIGEFLGEGNLEEMMSMWQVFMTSCRDKAFVQILLIDGPHVLGHEDWLFDTPVFAIVKDAFLDKGLIPDGLYSDDDKDILLRMITSGLAEAARSVVLKPGYDPSGLVKSLLSMFGR